MLPASSLAGQAFIGTGKVAGHQRIGTKQRRLATAAEIQAHLQVFDDVGAAQLDQRQILPDKRHARAHQRARQIEPCPATRAYAVLHAPGKFRQLHLQPGTCWRVHQVERLGRPPGLDAADGQAFDRALPQLAIRIDDDHHLRRVAGQVTGTELQGKALAALLVVAAFHHLRTGSAGHGSGVVAAVVGHHQQTITRLQLSLDAVDRRDDHR
ncbi:hypothetical protein D3C73_717960 [compost metagenome]